MIQTQFDTGIQIFRTDNGKEFFNSFLGNYLFDEGIVHQSTCVDTPQQNGIAERKNRHLLEVARSLMFSSNVPKNFWGEAVLTVAFLINRVPSKILNYFTPSKILQKFYPQDRLLTDISPRIFGCTIFIHVYSHNRSKLDPKSIKGIFIGYSPNKKGYKCYCPSTKRIYHTMDVTFFENQYFFPKTDIQG